MLAALWAPCARAGRSWDVACPAFDAIYLVDAARGWYLSDAWEAPLREACAGYKHIVFVGSSMGGFGALRYRHLATSVLAFSPQVDLSTAVLRPCGALVARWESETRSAERGAEKVEIHCALEEHLRHVLFAPFAAVVVHPLRTHLLSKTLSAHHRLVPILRGHIEGRVEAATKSGPTLSFYLTRIQTGTINTFTDNF